MEKKDARYHLAKDILDVTLPSTIQDVIMARVDVLPEDAKEVLQTGSVIGRDLSYELIKQNPREKSRTSLEASQRGGCDY